MQEGLTEHEADIGSALRLRVRFFQHAYAFVGTAHADERLGHCQATVQLSRCRTECFSCKVCRVFFAALDQSDLGFDRECVGFHVREALGLRR